MYWNSIYYGPLWLRVLDLLNISSWSSSQLFENSCVSVVAQTGCFQVDPQQQALRHFHISVAVIKQEFMVLRFHHFSADGIMVSKTVYSLGKLSACQGIHHSWLFLSLMKANTQMLNPVLTYYSNRVVWLCYCISFPGGAFMPLTRKNAVCDSYCIQKLRQAAFLK